MIPKQGNIYHESWIYNNEICLNSALISAVNFEKLNNVGTTWLHYAFIMNLDFNITDNRYLKAKSFEIINMTNGLNTECKQNFKGLVIFGGYGSGKL